MAAAPLLDVAAVTCLVLPGLANNGEVRPVMGRSRDRADGGARLGQGCGEAKPHTTLCVGGCGGG